MQTWEMVALLFGGGATGGAIVKLLQSIIEHKMNRKAKKEDKKAEKEAADLQQMDEDIKELKRRSERDYDRLNRFEEALKQNTDTSQALLKAVNALLLHNMNGNGSGKMETAQKELVDHIIDNK